MRWHSGCSTQERAKPGSHQPQRGSAGKGHGVALLERSADGARLTEAGKVLLQHGRLATLELDKAREEITALAIFPSSSAFDNGFHCTRLFSADVVVAGRPGHPLASAISIRDLASAKWIGGASRGREERREGRLLGKLGDFAAAECRKAARA